MTDRHWWDDAGCAELCVECRHGCGDHPVAPGEGPACTADGCACSGWRNPGEEPEAVPESG
jgi:hypothetical protein